MTRTRAFINMHIATVFFGLSGVFTALIPASAISVVWGRTAIAVVVLFLVCALKKRLPWQGVAAKEIGQLLFIGCLLGIHWWSFFYAIKLGGVAIGTSITSTTVSWARPSIVSRRGSRHRSGSQMPSGTGAPIDQPAANRVSNQSPSAATSSAQTECGIG